LKEHTAVFLRKMARLLRDGYGVNIGGIFGARLNVGGWFAGEFAPADKDRYVEVRTYFSGNPAKPLKELRTIRSKFTVRQA
jgi:hypothetical protein